MSDMIIKVSSFRNMRARHPGAPVFGGIHAFQKEAA